MIEARTHQTAGPFKCSSCGRGQSRIHLVCLGKSGLTVALRDHEARRCLSLLSLGSFSPCALAARRTKLSLAEIVIMGATSGIFEAGLSLTYAGCIRNGGRRLACLQRERTHAVRSTLLRHLDGAFCGGLGLRGSIADIAACCGHLCQTFLHLISELCTLSRLDSSLFL